MDSCLTARESIPGDFAITLSLRQILRELIICEFILSYFKKHKRQKSNEPHLFNLHAINGLILHVDLEATLKIAVIFILLIILIRRKMDIEWAMMLGCLGLWLLFLFPPAAVKAMSSGSFAPVGGATVEFLREILYGAIDTDTLLLIGTVYTITVLGSFMDISGHLKKLMESLGELMRDSRYVAAIAPSLIGLMPMPGGALFSCPMVEEVGKPIGLTNTRMAAINFWFRHVWEYVWPLYPGILMMSAIFRVDIRTIMLVHAPLTLATIIFGLIFLILPVKKPPRNGVFHTLRENIGKIFLALWPLLIIIVFTMMPFPNPDLFAMKADALTRIKLLLGLILSTIAYGIANRINYKSTLDVIIICLRKHTIMLVLSIMLFKHLVEHTGAAVEMAPFFAQMGLPPIVVIFLLCFIVGLLTGITIGYVGICFPIIMPLIGASGSIDLGLMQFAFATGFVAVMLTPVHLCFSLTRDYFDVEWGGMYKLIIPCSLLVLAVSLVIALIGLPDWG